jgi:uncharacterized membrane protein (UPF0127 family)
MNLNIKETHTFSERLRGLLGTSPDTLRFDALHIVPCKGIHTFGMTYAIDVAFLDRRRRVIRVKRNLLPKKICPAPPGTVSVLERPAQPSPWLVRGEVLL